ncbi:RusA family crossover junction endodeoxyribonuclease [Streptosporangium algeriense]|uniref:RusA family crossover junction endodeoxyribonuclease n=1 Tax=Streptosporangium algeriense TaxID=1682748 RepID=A0ABW3DRJ4_9ACTN
MTTPLLILTVKGVPAGQGNLRTGKHGKSYHANGSELRDWRERVRGAALDALGRHEWVGLGATAPCLQCDVVRKKHVALLGPVRLETVVTVAKPKTATAWPITRSSSDWDHYARAIGDALTGVVYADDSQVIDGRLIKSYPYVHEHALGEPGAVIRIWGNT